MPYQRKTTDEFDLEGNYGQGFEILTCETSWSQARARQKEYRDNGDGVPMRIIKRRVKKEA